MFQQQSCAQGWLSGKTVLSRGRVEACGCRSQSAPLILVINSLISVMVNKAWHSFHFGEGDSQLLWDKSNTVSEVSHSASLSNIINMLPRAHLMFAEILKDRTQNIFFQITCTWWQRVYFGSQWFTVCTAIVPIHFVCCHSQSHISDARRRIIKCVLQGLQYHRQCYKEGNSVIYIIT